METKINHERIEKPLRGNDEGKAEMKEPYLWVEPNPSGAARELMTFDAFFEFVRDWPSYAVAGEGIEIELAFMTDAEVAALPEV